MYFIDVQGTLISDTDKTPINAAVAFIEKLRRSETPFVLITNNTKQASSDFLAFLQKSGFAIDDRHYIDPLMILKETLPHRRIAAYGSEAFLGQLVSLGYELNFHNPQAIVIAIKHDFSADEYAQMIEFLLSGAELFGMHATSIYAKGGKRYPGVGAILEMLRFATQKNYSVVGKPSTVFYEAALEKLKAQNAHAAFEDITIVSDDVTGDLVGAKRLGMKTVFVTSGKYKNANEILPQIQPNLRPDTVLADISELL